MKTVSNRKRWESPVSRRVWYLPASPKDMVLADAIFAIEEMMRLKHAGSKLCDGCREMQSMLGKINQFLDMTANSADLIWPALKGKRVMHLFKMRKRSSSVAVTRRTRRKNR